MASHRAAVVLGLMLLLCAAAEQAEAGPAAGPGAGEEGEVVVPGGPIGAARQEATRQAVLGTWMAEVGSKRVMLRIYDDGTYRLDQQGGRFNVVGNELQLIPEVGPPVTYACELALDVMTLTGGGLPAPMRFARMPELGGYTDWVRALAPAWVGDRGFRLLTIALVVLVTWLVIGAVRLLSRWAVMSHRGPMKYIDRRSKHRLLTLHSLGLNLFKYIVYLTALGAVLGEFGVNYTTYLASLSVIGLAVGFGSQGLVQDMVTGFFVIFEGQYDVGDMVEISGQSGIVEELGLRMTKLRTYQGQVVVIPNRNIATVANFTAGAMEVRVDVALAEKARAGRAHEVMAEVGEQVRQQFPGVILQHPRIKETLTLPGGGCFVRMRLGIWPGQQWVVEQQLVPRLREALGRAGIDIADDRIVVFYRGQHHETITPWRRRFGRFASTQLSPHLQPTRPSPAPSAPDPPTDPPVSSPGS